MAWDSGSGWPDGLPSRSDWPLGIVELVGHDHLPERPSWDCLKCGEAWPCVPERKRLAAQLNGRKLRTLMWQVMEVAALEVDLPSDEFFARFLG